MNSQDHPTPGAAAPVPKSNAKGFRVRVAEKDAKGYLRGFLLASSPQDVRRHGYAFTQVTGEAWTFESRAQAEQKLRVLDRHFSFSVGFEVVEEVGSEVAA